MRLLLAKKRYNTDQTRKVQTNINELTDDGLIEQRVDL
jgi:hypothetical protein